MNKKAYIVYGYNLRDKKCLNGQTELLKEAVEQKHPALTRDEDLLYLGTVLSVLPGEDIELNKLVTIPNRQHQDTLDGKMGALSESFPKLTEAIRQRRPTVFITWPAY